MRLFIMKECSRYVFSLLVCIITFEHTLSAQKPARQVADSNYVRSYDTTVTGRIFLSQKYVSLQIKDHDTSLLLQYRPNSKLNLGIGATYGWLSLNASVGFGFLNLGDKGKGKTKNLDLQAHFYGPKTTFDIFTQRYKGFYLFPKGTAAGVGKSWYVRPDLNLIQIGASGYYVFNWRRFSYRAAYLQNEWQIKSRGSFLIGGEIFYGRAKADSAFKPAAFYDGDMTAEVYRVQFGNIGPGAGYAYTLVMAKHLFVTASVSGTISLALLKEVSYADSKTIFSFNPNYAFKAGMGYNSTRFTTSMTWVNNSVVSGGDTDIYTLHAGNVRLHVAYRFLAGKRLKKTLKPFLRLF